MIGALDEDAAKKAVAEITADGGEASYVNLDGLTMIKSRQPVNTLQISMVI